MLCLAVSLLTAGCGTPSSSDSPAPSDSLGTAADTLAGAPSPSDNTWMLAVMPGADCLPLYVARHTGLFRQLGLPVRLCSYDNVLDCDSALLRSFCIGGWAAGAQLPQVKERLSARYEIVRKGEAEWQLYVRGALRVGKTSGLKGRLIATSRHAAETAMLRDALSSAGLTTDAVYTPYINSQRTRLAMLDRGQVDAAFLTWPYTLEAKRGGHRLLYAVAGKDAAGALVIDKNWKRQHPTHMKQLLKAVSMARDSINIYGAAHYVEQLYADYHLHLNPTAQPQ